MEDQESDDRFVRQAVARMGVEDPTALTIRIDPQDTLRRIEFRLRGTMRRKVEGPDGRIIVKDIRLAEPVMNEEGINWLMRELEAVINKDTVQANLESSHYNDFISRFGKNLVIELVKRRTDFEISAAGVRGICDMANNAVELFLSLALGAGDRSALGAIKMIDRYGLGQERQGFRLFGR